MSGAFKEILAVFLRLGLVGFGGPIAMIAQMEEELCRKRAWLTGEHFSQAYALIKILPGPVAMQMAVFLGNVRGGIWGGWLAGIAFVLPAFLLVLLLSYLYANEGAMARLPEGFMPGMQIGALVVIAVSTWQLFKPFRQSLRAWGIALISGVAIFWQPRWEPLVILALGLTGVAALRRTKIGRKMHGFFALGLGTSAGAASGAAAAMSFGGSTLAQLTWVCFKAGAFVFGTGLAIVPLLEADVVGHYGWMTSREFMDGLAIGQVTPGPVVITATFIGYRAAGWLGACLATIAIFLPGILNVLYLLPMLWRRVSGTAAAAAFTAWSIPAVIGGIAATSLKLGEVTIHDAAGIALLLATSAVTFWFRPPAWIVIPASGVVMALLAAL